MRFESRRPWDLAAAVAIVATAGFFAVALPIAILQVPFGLLAVLVAPGYVLVAALFPEHKEPGQQGGLSGLERAALSLGLSIAVVPLLGLLLNVTPLGIRLVPILVTLLVFTALCAAIAAWRRSRVAEVRRFRIVLDVSGLSWSALGLGERVLTVSLVAAILVSSGVLVYVLVQPRPKETFTEFYVLGPSGKAEGYPSKMRPGESSRVIVGVANHEGASQNYAMRLFFVSGELVNNETGVQSFQERSTLPFRANAFTLEDGQTSETNVTFEAPATQGTYKLELQLDKSGIEAYRELHLWLNVTG